MLNSPLNVISNFVQKTFQILSLQEYHSIIQWLNNGKEFVIKQSERFQNQILPKYFRHRNVNSFIRQLNMYGFHKSRREPNKLIFSHPYFLEHRGDLLAMVRRKIKNGERQDFQQGEKQQEKNEPIQTRATRLQNPTIIEASKRDIEQKLTKNISKQTIEEETPDSKEEEKSYFAFNSFFNIDYQNLQLKNLISKSFIMDNTTELYQRIEEQTSLREIGTQEYLNYYDKNIGNCKRKAENNDLHSLAVRIFQTKNCLFQLDI